VRRPLQPLDAVLKIGHCFFESSETSIEIYMGEPNHRLSLSRRAIDLFVESLFGMFELFADLKDTLSDQARFLPTGLNPNLKVTSRFVDTSLEIPPCFADLPFEMTLCFADLPFEITPRLLDPPFEITPRLLDPPFEMAPCFADLPFEMTPRLLDPPFEMARCLLDALFEMSACLDILLPQRLEQPFQLLVGHVRDSTSVLSRVPCILKPRLNTIAVPPAALQPYEQEELCPYRM